MEGLIGQNYLPSKFGFCLANLVFILRKVNFVGFFLTLHCKIEFSSLKFEHCKSKIKNQSQNQNQKRKTSAANMNKQHFLILTLTLIIL